MNIFIFVPEENGVSEAVEPAVNHQDLHGDLAAAEKLHFIWRAFSKAKADIKEAAS